MAAVDDVRDRRRIAEEVAIVMLLTFVESAVFALLSLLQAPIRGTVVATFPSFVSFQLTKQLLSIFFALVPVWLVLYLARRPGEGGLPGLGLQTDRFGRDVGWGAVLAAVVGAAGLALYLAAVQMGANRLVVPVPPLNHWWTIPILVLGSIQNGLLEEVIVVGYFMTRLERLGSAGWVAVVASAVLRASYHLYQGWGGFLGNLAMGLFFGWVFLRWRRTWPLVVAHALIDIGAGVLFIAACPLKPYC